MELQPSQDTEAYSTVACRIHGRDFSQYEAGEQFLGVVWRVSVLPNFVSRDHPYIFDTPDGSPRTLGEIGTGCLKTTFPFEVDFCE